MPFPAILGNRIPLNLGARLTTPGNRIPLNLGVEDGGAPIDPPPDPTLVVGLVTASTGARWGFGLPSHRGLRLRWGGLAGVLHVGRVGWATPAQLSARTVAPWGTPATQAQVATLRWQSSSTAAAAAVRQPWDAPPLLSFGAAAAWGLRAGNVARGLSAWWASPPALHHGPLSPWRSAASGLHRSPRWAWSSPPKIPVHWRLPWGTGHGLEWLVRPPPPVVEPPTAPVVDPRRIGLNLACPVYTGPTNRLPLNLGITACYLGRPQRRAYIVLNEIEVVRLPDRLPIHVDAVSIDGGRDGWCWAARLALADPTQLAALQPTVTGPRDVEITLNGYAWVISIEAFDKGDVFGATDVSLSGRSVTAQLAEPYAAPRTRETTALRTMVQLADAEVAGSAVTADYGTVDWLVPGGAWYYDGLTPMSALIRLAEASGAVVQSHPTLPVVQIRPRHPVSPWAWTTTAPDVVIQDDIVTGARLQLQSKPLFDAVVVAGERVGVTARVIRTGEAGQTYAPQQVDQLITHADGARERGRNVLSDRGGQASIEHDLPLFGAPLQPGQPGLVLPLMLAQRIAGEGTWHGLVTAVRIEARRQDKAVDIVQTVTIERHYADAD